jgi:hypothetical protein
LHCGFQSNGQGYSRNKEDLIWGTKEKDV